jgi:hypothetical protein
MADSFSTPATPSRRLSRRRLLAGTAAAAAAAPLAAGSWGPWGTAERFFAYAQAAPIQFTLVPTSIATLFPNATASVSITPGDAADDLQMVAQNLPANIRFTCFFIESPSKPFGMSQYVFDLVTDNYGYGTASFHGKVVQAFAMDAENAGQSDSFTGGPASGTQLTHFGIWFANLQDAQTVLNNPNLTGTPFAPGTPPAHAGPLAMADSGPDPKF